MLRKLINTSSTKGKSSTKRFRKIQLAKEKFILKMLRFLKSRNIKERFLKASLTQKMLYHIFVNLSKFRNIF